MTDTILAFIFQSMVAASGHDISMESYECMTYNIYHESRGEGEIGSLAVAHLVEERVKDKRFPSTVCGVVYYSIEKPTGTECAFSWVCDSHSNRIQVTSADGIINELDLQSLVESATIAALTLTKQSENPCQGANYYYNPRKASPRWAKIYTPKCRIGEHTFLRREKGSLL